MTRFVPSIALASLFLYACNTGTPPETPAQAIQSIIQLYEARDFDTLVRTRYAEIGKAANEQQIQALVARFSARFQDDGNLDQAIATYTSLLAITPEIAAGDSVATFALPDRFIRLSKMPDGKWGFHL